MTDKPKSESLKAQVQNKLDEPLKDVMIRLINETGSPAEASRRLSKQIGITIKPNTFSQWAYRAGITLKITAEVN